MSNKINIRPPTSVYATYSRLSYQPWTAIAEFVDNSTQSYFDNEEILKKSDGFSKLDISINYEISPEFGDILTIKDNAYGMEIEDLERAIVLDRPPRKRTGRNEFGMGLKTAACWFGNHWRIRTTQLGSNKEYTVEIDVDKLAIYKDEEVDIGISDVSKIEHYTVIEIRRLNKKITGSRTIAKIKELLASIYRQDLRNGDVRISFKGNELTFSDPQIYLEEFTNGDMKEWKTDVDFSIPHEKFGDLNVKGFVAIRIPASLKDAGLTLMRRGRVIIGGPEKNYRPVELFGDTNSFAYQRIFGELHMDNWPVTQAKDDFDWHSGGLEELFICEMDKYIKPLKAKAESIRVRPKITPSEVVKSAAKTFSTANIIDNPSVTPKETSEDVIENGSLENEIAITTDTGVQTSEVTVIGSHIQVFEFQYNTTPFRFDIELDHNNTHGDWISVAGQDNKYQLRLNIRHPFFKPFIDDQKFVVTMLKFVMAMVLSEFDAIKIAVDGLIDPSDIRNGMNKYLERLSHKDLS